MKDFKLYTQFNFAKCVHLSLLSVPEGNLCSSPEGISDFIKPYLQEYPWYEYIYNSNDQFDENLPELINAGNHFISLYINTDDCLIEFSTEQPDSSDNLYYSFTTAGIYFTVYFD